MSSILIEPGYKVGDPLGNFQRVTEVQFEAHPDGTATELVFDTGGNYFQAWYGPEQQYSTREPRGNLRWLYNSTMPVAVPYVPGMLEVRTIESVRGFEYFPVRIDPAREWEYYDFLVAFFEEMVADPMPAVVLEHDVIYRPDVDEGFRSCDQPWCGHLYSGRYAPRNADELEVAWRLLWTGCQRFRPVIAPAALEILYGIGGPRRTWRQVGDVLSMGLAAEGWERHLHELPVEHLQRSDGS